MSDQITVRAHVRRKNLADPTQLSFPCRGLEATPQGVAKPRSRTKAPSVPPHALRTVLSHPARTADPETSHAAADAIEPKRLSAAMRLLEAFNAAGDPGLTDEGAAALARVGGCWWRRCSDLRELGYIVPTGMTRLSTAGVQVRICRITGIGRNVALGLR